MIISYKILKSGIFICCFFFLQTACNYIEKQGGDARLPESVGDFAELVVVGDKSSTAILKEGIAKSYEQLAPGLPDPSGPLYKIRYTDETYFKGFFQKHYHITMLLHKGNIEIFKPFFTTGDIAHIETKLNAGETGYVAVSNVWTKPQKVNFIYGPNAQAISDWMVKNADQLVNKAFKTEVQLGISKIFGSKIYTDSFFMNHFHTKGYGLPKAPSFRIAANKADFVWLRKSGKKYDYGIFMYDEPYTNQKQLTHDYVIGLRNEKTKAYIHGQLDSTFMQVEPLFKALSKVITFNGMYALETRGWWKLEGDYMGGPFVLYTIYDEKLGKIISLEGNVFAPNEPKVQYLRELEVMLHALKTK